MDVLLIGKFFKNEGFMRHLKILNKSYKVKFIHHYCMHYPSDSHKPERIEGKSRCRYVNQNMGKNKQYFESATRKP